MAVRAAGIRKGGATVRVFVTGLAGFGAAGLARRLVEAGHYVVGCDVVAPEEAWRLRDLIDGEKIGYVWSSVGDLDADDLDAPDAVVHMAAVADVSAGHNMPRHTVRVNVDETVHLLELCRLVQPGRMVLAGTAHELEAAGDVTLTEDSPIQPGTPYGFSKSCQELAFRVWGRAYGIPWVVMRNGIVAGRHMRRQIAPYLWCRRILQGLPTRLDDPTQTRDLTDARDTAEAWLRTLEAPVEDVQGQVLQVSRGIETPVGDLLEMCYQACEGIRGSSTTTVTANVTIRRTTVRIPRKIVPGTPRPGEEGMRERFDCSKTRRILCWEPRYSPEDTIRDVAEWAAEELRIVGTVASSR
jgi:nucleoside-diphosphate-sugar epimerase